MSDVSTKPVIFISFSHKDEPEKPGPDEVAWLSFVQSFLEPAVTAKVFDLWADDHLHGSDELDPEIARKLAACDIFVLLVSRYSLASTWVVDKEITTIRQRQKDGQDVRMFPIVLSPTPEVALKPLKDVLLSPKDGKPLSLMSKNDREVAMSEIADDIAAVAEQIAARKAASEASKRLASVQMRETFSKGLENLTAVRAFVDIAHLPETPYERLVGRETQLKRLDDAWTDPKTKVLSLIAEGGAGKSALVNEWLTRMQADGYRAAETVLGWSFYSQGTKERATSAEPFLNWAIEKLGIKIETTSATAKGEAIAEAMGKHRILLVLDGCEPLQHGLDKQQGELKDKGLRALLRRLASVAPGEAQGLIVLTSRLAVKDIGRWKDSTAPVVDVYQLSDEAGAAILRDNGVWGTDKELHEASQDFGGHPLALGLLASYLKEKYFGDARRRDHVRGLLHDEDNPRHDHARRVMESYEKEWLAGEPVERAIMHLIGLFDRPASGDCLGALRRQPAIPGLTEALIDAAEAGWQRAVSRLRDARLLAPVDPSAPEALDAHPLVREWFGERLKQENEVAWKTAHRRLYEHLRDTTKEGDTPTLEDLAPLYQAIPHGCRAELYQEALNEIYNGRICRGGGEFYSMHKLGAVGNDLAIISWFFDPPYETPIADLRLPSQAWVLAVAAFGLRGEGRFLEAIPTQRASLHMREQAEHWSNAARSASNLSEVELLVGRVAAAEMTARQSVTYADRSNGEIEMIRQRATHANALHAAGQYEKAARLFEDAELRQEKRQSEYPLLYSVQGNWYCDLLLAQGKYGVARGRAKQTLEWVSPRGYPLDIGLDALTLSRASFGLTIRSIASQGFTEHVRDEASEASRCFEQAVDNLRGAGQNDHTPRGLLARAAFRRSIGDWGGTARDLDEVEEIAEPGPMKLFLCDMALERARLAFARIEAFAPLNGLIDESSPKPRAPDAAETTRLEQDATKQLSIAADYIKSCGYHRRDEELAELQAVMRGERQFAELPPRV
jgi:tetratricopeptide (TPR) repeat protein